MIRLLYLLIIILTATCCTRNLHLESEIDNILRQSVEKDYPGIAAAVRLDDQLIYNKGFGFADIDNKVEVNINTNFRLASITKQFTAFSILILEKNGKLNLEDNLTKYFPELTNFGNNITLKNILEHTSGLLDYESLADKSDSVQLRDKDVYNIIKEQDTTYFLPGSKHRYSNTGYAILALLIEKVSKQSFADFLNDNIFEPLEMRSTVAYEKGISKIDNRAYGYVKSDLGFAFSDQSKYSAVLGDGGIYSSTTDLLKWDDEINNPTLLPKNKLDLIFIKGRTTGGDEFDYGLGWRLDPYKQYDRYYHTGGTSGFSNIYLKLPDLKLTIIVLINVRDYDTKGMSERISELFID